MMKISLILALCLSFFFPPNDVWDILSELKFNLSFDEKLDDVVYTPKPNAAIKNLIGKDILIQGFKTNFIIEPTKENAILLCRFKHENSTCSNPYGGESFIEIHPNKAIHFVEGSSYLFKGKFELNTTNYLDFPFILKEAECLNCE